MTTKAKKRKRATKPAKRKRPVASRARPGKDLGEWRWVLAGVVILIIVILVWGKRIP